MSDPPPPQASETGRLGSIGLLELDPDLATGLPPDERQLAERVTLPVVTLRRGQVRLEELMRSTGAFAGVLLEGILMRRIAVGRRWALTLIAPGELVTPGSLEAQDGQLGPSSAARYAAGEPVRMALLGQRALIAARRFPDLIRRLVAQLGEQQDRLYRQLAICQLSRVEDRIVAMLWLLAESWGRVTPMGMKVPLELTHQVLGELIGARRPTVTLALKELSDQSRVVRQGTGWLLLDAPPELAPVPDAQLVRLAAQAMLAGSSWGAPEPGDELDLASVERLHTRVTRLRDLYEVNARRHERAVARARARAESREVRRQIESARGQTSGNGVHHHDRAGDVAVAAGGQGQEHHPAVKAASAAVGGLEDHLLAR